MSLLLRHPLAISSIALAALAVGLFELGEWIAHGEPFDVFAEEE